MAALTQADVIINAHVNKAKFDEAKKLIDTLRGTNLNVDNLRKDVVRNSNIGSQLSKLSEPLGRITGQANEFEKSMAASNARVIAFGASATVISSVVLSFKHLASSAIEVQKSLKELQVISEASNTQMASYSDKLFNIARNTATSFTDASKAALEFSRQGLSMNEILNRTNDTMIMMRITGISLDEAIGGLTATINAFSNEDLSSSTILNALSAIDLAAAASTDGIIKGMSRSASAARAAGVSFRELASFIATLQETTGLQGGVLGNSAKSIFTRIADPEKLKTLRNFRIKVNSDNGELLTTMDILRNMALAVKNVEGGLSAFGDRSELVSFMKEMSGLYQIDKLTSFVNDLGKTLADLDKDSKGREVLAQLNSLTGGKISIRTETGEVRKGIDVLKELDEAIKNTTDEATKSGLESVYEALEKSVSKYDRNLMNSNKSSDQAYQKNELLNQTLDSQIQKLKTSAIEFGAAFGNVSLIDTATSALSMFNSLFTKIIEGVKGEGIFAPLQAVVGALSSLLSGPGLIIALATIAKQFGSVAAFAKDSWISFMGLNKQSKERAIEEQKVLAVQNDLLRMLQSQGEFSKLLNSEELSREQKAKAIIQLYQKQVSEMQKMVSLAAEIAPLVSKGVVPVAPVTSKVKNKASGDRSALDKEKRAISLGIGGARQNDSPVFIEDMLLDGKKQSIVANSGESFIPSKKGGFSILNRDQQEELYNAKNFAKGSKKWKPIKEKGGSSRDQSINPFIDTTQIEEDFSSMEQSMEESTSKMKESTMDASLKMLKWSFILSMTSGAVESLTNKSEGAVRWIGKATEAFQRLMLINMGANALGINISPKGSFKGAAEGFSKAAPLMGKGLSSTIKGVGIALKGLLGPIGLVFTAFQVFSSFFPDESAKLTRAIGEAIGLVDTPAEKAAKSINKMSEAALKNAIENNGFTSDEIKSQMDEILNAQLNAIAVSGDKVKKYETKEEARSEILQNVLDPKQLSDRRLAEEFLNSSTARVGDYTKGIQSFDLSKIDEDVRNKILANFEKSIKNSDIKGLKGSSVFSEKTGKTIMLNLTSMNEDQIQELLAYNEAKQRGLMKGVMNRLSGSKVYRDFMQNPEDKKAQEDLALAANKAVTDISMETSKAFADIQTNDPQAYKKAMEGTKKEREEFQYKVYKAIFSGDTSALGDIKMSPETKKNIQKSVETLAVEIEGALNDLSKEMNRRKILDSIMSSAEMALASMSIYEEGGTRGNKGLAQSAVNQEKAQKDIRNATDDVRNQLLNFLKDTSSNIGEEGQITLKALESVLKDSTSTVDDMLSAMDKYRTSKTAGNILFNNADEKKYQKEREEAISKMLAVSAAKIDEALKSSFDSLQKTSDYLQKIQIDKALTSLEKAISDSALAIKRIENNELVQEAGLNVSEAINPSEINKSAIALSKAALGYQSEMGKIAESTKQFYAEIEKDALQKIGEISNPYDKEELLGAFSSLKESGGFSDTKNVVSLFEKIAQTSEKGQREAIQDQIEVSLSLLRSSSTLYEAATLMKEAFKGGKEKETPVSGFFGNIQGKIENSFAKTGGLFQQKGNAPTLQMPPFLKSFFQKTVSPKKEDEKLGKITENISKLERQQRKLSSSPYSSSGTGAIKGNEMAGRLEADSAQKYKAASDLMISQMNYFGQQLEINASRNLLLMSSKLKQASEALEIFKLKAEGRDLDFDLASTSMPDSVKELISGARLEDKVIDAQKEIQLQAQRDSAEQQKALYEQISKIANPEVRGKVYEEAGKGISNETLIDRIATALTEQEINGTGRDQLFSAAINDFGEYNKKFQEAVDAFKEATDKYKGSEEIREKINNSPISFAKEDPLLKNFLPTQSTIFLDNKSNFPDVEEAVPVSSVATGEIPPWLKENQDSTEQNTDALLEANKEMLRSSSGRTNLISSQNNLKKALLELKTFQERFLKLSRESQVLPTEEGRRSSLREAQIYQERSKTNAVGDNRNFKERMDEVSRLANEAQKNNDQTSLDKYTAELTQLQREFNERKEFKTIGESATISMGKIQDDAKRLEENLGSMVVDLRDGLVNAFSDGLSGAKSLSEALQNMIVDLANKIIKEGLNNMFSNLIGGGSSGTGIFGAIGGLFADGGKVTGGSGTKDDVPALLTGGEYVIKKDSAKSLGSNFLNKINERGVQAFATGGYVKDKNGHLYTDMGAYPLDISSANNGTGGFFSPSLYGKDAITGSKDLRAFARQTVTSGANDVLNNSSDKYGSSSLIALENESWRISAQGRAADTVYNQNTEADKQAAFSAALQEEEARRQYEEQKKARKKSQRTALLGAGAMLLGGWALGGIGGDYSLPGLLGESSSVSKGLLGVGRGIGITSAANQDKEKTRGLFKSKASGGTISGSSGRDNIPTNLMGGEYVISRNAANKVGTPFLDALNSNKVSFSNSQSSPMSGNTQQADNSEEVLKKLDELVSVFKEVGEKVQGNVSVNVLQNGDGTESEQANQNGFTTQQTQELAKMIKQSVMDTIREQKRLGGQLSRI